MERNLRETELEFGLETGLETGEDGIGGIKGNSSH